MAGTDAAHLEPLLAAASVPAMTVNWCGDEAVSAQEWTTYFAEILGCQARIEVQPVPGASRGSVGDPTKRLSITGPCRVEWRTGFRQLAEQFHPDRIMRD